MNNKTRIESTPTFHSPATDLALVTISPICAGGSSEQPIRRR